MAGDLGNGATCGSARSTELVGEGRGPARSSRSHAIATHVEPIASKTRMAVVWATGGIGPGNDRGHRRKLPGTCSCHSWRPVSLRRIRGDSLAGGVLAIFP